MTPRCTESTLPRLSPRPARQPRRRTPAACPEPRACNGWAPSGRAGFEPAETSQTDPPAALQACRLPATQTALPHTAHAPAAENDPAPQSVHAALLVAPAKEADPSAPSADEGGEGGRGEHTGLPLPFSPLSSLAPHGVRLAPEPQSSFPCLCLSPNRFVMRVPTHPLTLTTLLFSHRGS